MALAKTIVVKGKTYNLVQEYEGGRRGGWTRRDIENLTFGYPRKTIVKKERLGNYGIYLQKK